MNKEQIKKIAESKGWTDLGPQKMKVLMSFRKNDIRMNVYTTTGTVQFQNLQIMRSSSAVYYNVTLEQFETLC